MIKAARKWTPSPLTLILLGLIAWLWFRPPAEVSEENRAAPPWQVTLTDGRVVKSGSLCPQGAGRGCKDAEALKDSDPLRAQARVESYASTTTLRGKVVLVNFWATWCPYCRKEKPVIDAFWKDYRNKGFEVVSISVDGSPEKIAAWMQDKGYAFMAAPANASVAAAFGNITSVPTSFIVDGDGHIRHTIAGQVHYPRLEKLVAPLLGATAHTPGKS
ncbi:MAG TPA: TlpA disulfide reductase family protein [Thiobacillus sp.]